VCECVSVSFSTIVSAKDSQKNMDCSIVKESVRSAFKKIDALLASACTLALSAILAKIFVPGAKIPFIGIQFSEMEIIIVFIILSIWHTFILKYAIDSLRLAWVELAIDQRKELFDEIVHNGGIATRGSFYQEDDFDTSADIFRLNLRFSLSTTIVFSAIAAFALVAMIPFELNWATLMYGFIACNIVLVNWMIGSNWNIALADLARNRDTSIYFDNIDRFGILDIVYISIPVRGKFVKPSIFLISCIAQAILFSVMFAAIVILLPVWIIQSIYRLCHAAVLWLYKKVYD